MNDEKTTDDKTADQKIHDLSPEERTAQAVRAREAGDRRPVTQIEGEALGQADDREQRRLAREQRRQADLEEEKADRDEAERAANPGGKHSRKDT